MAGVVIWFGGSLNQMFTWIMGTLGAGVLLPNVLRWYWWRLNGWGYAAGAITGMVLSLLQVVLQQMGLSYPVYVTFPIILVGVTLVCVVVTLRTEPTCQAVLQAFYRSVRPFGAWGPIRRQVETVYTTPRRESFAIAGLAVLLGIPWMISLYLLPMYAIIRQWTEVGVCAGSPGGGWRCAVAGVVSKLACRG